MDKKTKKPVGRPPKDEGRTVQLHLKTSQSLRDHLELFRESIEFPPDVTDVVVKAIEEFLAKRGFWPPKDKDA